MKQRRKQYKDWYLLPLILVLSVIPLIVRMYVYETKLEQFEWFASASNTQTDFFYVYKAWAMVILAVVMGYMLLKKMYSKNKSFKFEPLMYALGGYVVLVLFSALFSSYHYYVIHGTYEVFESIWVILSYIIILIYAYQFVNSESDVTKIIKWSAAGISVLLLIGAFQYLKLDFFRTTMGRMMITNKSYWESLDQISFTFEPGRVYTTLYNPDYMAFYVGLLLPIAISVCFASKQLLAKIVSLLIAFLLVINAIGSDTSSVNIAIAMMVVISCYLLISRNKIGCIIATTISLVLAVGGVVAFFATPFGDVVQSVTSGGIVRHSDFAIKSIETTDEDVIITVNDKEFHVSYEVNEDQTYAYVQCYDGDGFPVETVLQEDGAYRLTDSAYADCTVMPALIDDMIGVQVYCDGHNWIFIKNEEGSYYYYNAQGKMVKMPDIERVNIFEDDAIGNRGLIWNNTLPLLKKHIFIGSGTNTFMMEYPQNDYIYKEYSNTKFVYDVKAHCWLLQQCVENGVLATICLLIAYLMYFVRSIQIYRRANLREYLPVVGMGMFVGTFGYMIASLANDSNVTTAPLFWAIWGMGMAVNRLVENSQNTKNEKCKEK